MSGAQDFRPSSQEDLAPSGEMRRIAANLAAIRVLRTVQGEQRPATADEQLVLAAWSGWGAVPHVFDEVRVDAARYQPARQALRELLTGEEYATAARTTQYAHYTDAAIVQAMWAGLLAFGFDGGRVLEPGCGSGNFIGFAPENAAMFGVEMDPVTAGIAAALYPSAEIRTESFAATRFPGPAFDVAIGNPPFGKVQLYDPLYNPGNHSIHNHFILKSLDLVRPGGLVAVVTSRYTLDAGNDAIAARQRMAHLAELVAAVRLPSRAHARAAGTNVITDLLVLRRRPDGEVSDKAAAKDFEPFADRFQITPTLRQDQDEEEQEAEPGAPAKVWVNAYFQRHPEAVLGTMTVGHGMYREDLQVEGFSHRPLAEQIAQALGDAVARATQRGTLMVAATDRQQAAITAAQARERYQGPDAEAMEGLILANQDGTFSMVCDGWIDPHPHPCPRTQAAELRALIELRHTVVELLRVEQSPIPDDDPHLVELRGTLNTQYDAYLATFGPINRGITVTGTALDENGEKVISRRLPPQGGFRADPFAGSVMALELYDEESNTAEKAPIFTQRVLRERRIPQHADSALDAMRYSLEAHNGVDLDFVASLLDLPGPAQARAALGELVFDNPPDGDQLIPADEYLSGNVRMKLESALLAAHEDPRFEANARALRAVLPPDVTAGDITARIGAAWIEPEILQQFLRETLFDASVRVQHGVGNVWKVEGREDTEQARRIWGIPEKNAIELVEALLTNAPIRIYPRFPEGREVSGWERARIVQRALDATAAAQARAEELNVEFNDWLWRDPQRAAEHVKTYNWTYNYYVPRDYSTAQLTLPGLSPVFTLREHQVAAISRILSEPSVLLAHEVGAGKTLEMVAGAMELGRRGLVNKPALVVPNHMLGQVHREFLQAYPAARLLAVSSEDVSGSKRRTFTARVALGTYDAVIMTHSLFVQLRMSDHARAGFVASQLTHYDAYLHEHGQDEGANRRGSIVKATEAQRERAENKLTRATTFRRDPGLSFEQLGIDYLFLDEAHLFKNLHLDTRTTELSPAGSARATDLEMKLHYLRSTYGNRVATFATATPTSNSICETYIMLKFLRPDLLAAAGFGSFDAWITHHAQKKTELEVAPEGGIRSKTRFSSFLNIPELVTMFRAVADVKTAEDLKLPVPQIAGGGPEIVQVAPTRAVLRYMAEIKQRAEDVRAQLVDPTEDNLLKITTQGTQVGIDTRLVGLDSDGPQKLDYAAEKIAAIWEQTKDFAYRDERKLPSPQRGALQIVFCDWGVPNAEARVTGAWTTYDYLKQQLTARGLPAEKIRFVHEAGDDNDAKQRLFAEARNGKIAVLIGSTPLMGVGTNIQHRAIALHHMDCDWRPDIIQQREGRIVRQLNQNKQVRILRYVTLKSTDAYRWQTVARKAAFIDQVMLGSATARDAEEPISEAALSFAEITAIAADNQTLLAKARVDKEVREKTALQTRHSRNQADFARAVQEQGALIKQLEAELPAHDAAVARFTPTRGEAFTMTVDGRPVAKRAEAAVRLRDAILGHYQTLGAGPRTIGHLGGFDLVGAVDRGEAPGYRVTVADTALPPLRLPLAEVNTGRPIGLITKLENRVEQIEQVRAAAYERLQFARRQLESAQANLGKPFAHAARLVELQIEAADLDAELAAAANQDEGPAPLDLSAVFDSLTTYQFINGDNDGHAVGERLAARLQELVDDGNTAQMVDGRFVLTFRATGREVLVEPTSPQEAERWLGLTPAEPKQAGMDVDQVALPVPAMRPDPVLLPPVFDEQPPMAVPYPDRAEQRAAEERIAAALQQWQLDHPAMDEDAAIVAATGREAVVKTVSRRAQRVERGRDESRDYDAAGVWGPWADVLRTHAQGSSDPVPAQLAAAVGEHIERFRAVFHEPDAFTAWLASPEPAYELPEQLRPAPAVPQSVATPPPATATPPAKAVTPEPASRSAADQTAPAPAAAPPAPDTQEPVQHPHQDRPTDPDDPRSAAGPQPAAQPTAPASATDPPATDNAAPSPAPDQDKAQTEPARPSSAAPDDATPAAAAPRRARPDRGPEPDQRTEPGGLARPTDEVFGADLVEEQRTGLAARFTVLSQLTPNAERMLDDARYAQRHRQEPLRPLIAAVTDAPADGVGLPPSARDLLVRHLELRAALTKWATFLHQNPASLRGQVARDFIAQARDAVDQIVDRFVDACPEAAALMMPPADDPSAATAAIPHRAAPAAPAPARTTPDPPPAHPAPDLGAAEVAPPADWPAEPLEPAMAVLAHPGDQDPAAGLDAEVDQAATHVEHHDTAKPASSPAPAESPATEPRGEPAVAPTTSSGAAAPQPAGPEPAGETAAQPSPNAEGTPDTAAPDDPFVLFSQGETLVRDAGSTPWVHTLTGGAPGHPTAQDVTEALREFTDAGVEPAALWRAIHRAAHQTAPDFAPQDVITLTRFLLNNPADGPSVHPAPWCDEVVDRAAAWRAGQSLTSQQDRWIDALISHAAADGALSDACFQRSAPLQAVGDRSDFRAAFGDAERAAAVLRHLDHVLIGRPGAAPAVPDFAPEPAMPPSPAPDLLLYPYAIQQYEADLSWAVNEVLNHEHLPAAEPELIQRFREAAYDQSDPLVGRDLSLPADPRRIAAAAAVYARIADAAQQLRADLEDCDVSGRFIGGDLLGAVGSIVQSAGALASGLDGEGRIMPQAAEPFAGRAEIATAERELAQLSAAWQARDPQALRAAAPDAFAAFEQTAGHVRRAVNPTSMATTGIDRRAALTQSAQTYARVGYAAHALHHALQDSGCADFTPEAAHDLRAASFAALGLAAQLHATAAQITPNPGHGPEQINTMMRQFDATPTAQALWASRRPQPDFQAFVAAWRRLDTATNPDDQRRELHGLASAAHALIEVLQDALEGKNWGNPDDITVLRQIRGTANSLATPPQQPRASAPATTPAPLQTSAAPQTPAAAPGPGAGAEASRPAPPARPGAPVPAGAPVPPTPASPATTPAMAPSAPAAPAPGPAAPPAPVTPLHELPAAQRAALLAANGHHLFPVAENSKVPALKGVDWGDVSTNDPAALARRLDGRRNSRLNLGLDLGKDNLLVVDIDVDPTKPPIDGIRDGYQAFDRLRAGRALPATLTVTTPRGGQHLYFRVPADHPYRNSAGKLAPFVDIRTAGGYVVAPGSQINGRAYQVTAEGPPHAPIADLPAWLGAELVRIRPDEPPAPSETHDPADRAAADSTQARAYGDGALERARQRILQEATPGRHNETIRDVSLGIGNLVGGGMVERQQAEAVLLDAAKQAAGRRDADPAKMLDTIRRALDHGARRPRETPQRRENNKRPAPEIRDTAAKQDSRDPDGVETDFDPDAELRALIDDSGPKLVNGTPLVGRGSTPTSEPARPDRSRGHPAADAPASTTEPADPYAADLAILDTVLTALEQRSIEELAPFIKRFEAVLERAGYTAVQRGGQEPQPQQHAAALRAFQKAVKAAKFASTHPIRAIERTLSGLVGLTMRGDGPTHRFVGAVLSRTFHALARLIDRHQTKFARDPQLAAVGQAAHTAAEALKPNASPQDAPTPGYPRIRQVRAAEAKLARLHHSWQKSPLSRAAQSDPVGTELAFAISEASAPPPWSGPLTEPITRREAQRRREGAAAVERLLDRTPGADPAQRTALGELGRALSEHADGLTAMANRMRDISARAAVAHRPGVGDQPPHTPPVAPGHRVHSAPVAAGARPTPGAASAGRHL